MEKIYNDFGTEIKFKGHHKPSGEEIIYTRSGLYTSLDGSKTFDKKDCFLGQFTGHVDKYQNEIYGGHVLKDEKNKEYYFASQSSFGEGQWDLCQPLWEGTKVSSYSKVIENLCKRCGELKIVGWYPELVEKIEEVLKENVKKTF